MIFIFSKYFYFFDVKSYIIWRKLGIRIINYFGNSFMDRTKKMKIVSIANGRVRNDIV